MEASRRRVAIFRRDGSAFAYVVLLVVSAVDAAGYSLIAPVGPAIAASTGVSPSIIGLLVATFPLGIMVGFIVAALAVQRGRTHVASVTSLAIVVVGSLGFVIGQRVDIYFASRLVMGVGSGAVWISVAFNIFARCSGQESRCMSRIFAAYSVGGLLGSIIGATGGVSTPFGAYAVIELTCIGLVVVMGPVRGPTKLRNRLVGAARAAVLVVVWGQPVRLPGPRDDRGCPALAPCDGPVAGEHRSPLCVHGVRRCRRRRRRGPVRSSPRAHSRAATGRPRHRGRGCDRSPIGVGRGAPPRGHRLRPGHHGFDHPPARRRRDEPDRCRHGGVVE